MFYDHYIKINYFEYTAIDAKLLGKSFEAKDVSERHVFQTQIRNFYKRAIS